jgi:septation ring formation regulator EzrA
MATSVETRLRTSEAANDLLRAEITTQNRSLELYQARVAANHQLQAQVTSLTAEVSRINNECSYSQNAYRGIQVQYNDLRTQHTNALNDGEGLHEQLRQSQSRCTQAEKRSKVLETEVERLQRKMGEVRKALDDPSL